MRSCTLPFEAPGPAPSDGTGGRGVSKVRSQPQQCTDSVPTWRAALYQPHFSSSFSTSMERVHTVLTDPQVALREAFFHALGLWP